MRPIAILIASLLAPCAAMAAGPGLPAAAAASAAEAYKPDATLRSSDASSLRSTSAGPCTVVSASPITLHDAKRNKDLQVAATFPKEGGPWPVIVFSHGAGGSGTAYMPLVRFWVSHGYVCLAPTHADSLSLREKTEEASGGMAGIVSRALRDHKGWENRARDVSFLIDSLAGIEEKVPALKGRMDAKRLGVGGHSYGAFTTQLIGGATVDLPGGEKGASFADPRPLALLVLSGQGIAQMGLVEHSWDNIKRPMMVMTGTRDRGARGQDWPWRLEPYKFAPPPDKYSVLIDGASHMSFLGRLAEGDGAGGIGLLRALLTGAADDETDQKAVFVYIKISTLAFWDAYLKGDAKAKAYLASDALPAYSKGAVRLERK